MKNLIPYKLFEAVTASHPDGVEFLEELEKSPYKEILDSWFAFTPRRTGRVTVKGDYLPSQTFFEKTQDGRNWYYIYSASGRYYGRQEGDLQNLFGRLIKDSIRKGAPSYLNRKDLDRVLSDDEWIFSNLDTNHKLIYERIKGKLTEESGIISDFKGIKFPLLDQLQDLGLVKIEDSTLGSIVVVFVSNYRYATGYHLDTKYWKLIYALLGDPKGDTYLSESRSVIFYPKGEGTKTRSKSADGIIKCEVGYGKVEDVITAIENIVKKYMLKNELGYYQEKQWGEVDQVSKESINLANAFYISLVRSSFEGKVDSSEQILDNYFKKNPTEIYLLNSMPKLKADIIKRTGIRDLSHLGDILSRNYF